MSRSLIHIPKSERYISCDGICISLVKIIIIILLLYVCNIYYIYMYIIKNVNVS